MKKTRLVFLALLGFMSAPLQADFFGLANGRTANLDNMANMSVEGGVNLKSDFNTFGARFNYKLSPDIVLFGDLGQSEFGAASGLTFGFGGFYQLRNVSLLENTDLALKGSYHTGELEVDGCGDIGNDLVGIPGIDLGFFDEICDISASEIAFEVLISGDQLSTTNFAWYANAGLHIIDAGASSTEIGLGGGIVGDLGFGDFYVGLDLIEELFIVGGIRYNLN